MNMKKTIAGVMAGAMAVSAMATVVSAADRDSISLTYDLKKYVEDKNSTKGKVSYVINFSNGGGNTFQFPVTSWGNAGFWCNDTSSWHNVGGVDMLTVGIAGTTSTSVFSHLYEKDGQYYYGDYSSAGGYTQKDPALTNVEVSFTALPDLVKSPNATRGETVTVKWAKPDDAEAITGVANATNNLGGRTFTIFLDTTGDGTTVKDKLHTAHESKLDRDSDILDISGFNVAALGQTEAVGSTGYEFASGSIKLTYEVPTSVIMEQAELASWNHGGNAPIILGAMGIDSTGYATLGQKNFAVDIKADTNVIGAPQAPAIASFTVGADAEKVYPMKSSLTQPGDVVAALQARKAGGKYYTNPVAVLNDAIANNENVVFEFRTYQGYVGTKASNVWTGWVGVDQGYDYEVPQAWHNPTFGQHLYNTNTYGDYQYALMGSGEYDMYGSYSSAWAQNLFTGAITVNSGLTMQLSDTDKFNWGNSSLSFDWFTITDEGKVTEAKTFLTKMLLYTPVDWYWDTLVVTVGGAEDDSVLVGEGAEGDGDIIDDGDGDVVVIDPVEDIPEVVETQPAVVETEAPEVVTPAAPVESPKTGNAPVALAVIPVALAAAAVVAKKRG